MTDLKSNNEFDSLETFFNKRLKDVSDTPSEATWMQIEEELNKHAKQKHKRRFLWYFSSALLLVCGLATLWYFMPKNKTTGNTIASTQTKTENTNQVVSNNSSTDAKKENSSTKNTNVTTTENSTKKAEESVKTSEKTTNIKVQLGAFKNEADLTVFNKIPYKVIKEKSGDGYIRYYAETSSKETSALEKIQLAGFTDAFVKNNFNESSKNTVVKNEGTQEQASMVVAMTIRKTSENKTPAEQNQNAKTNNSVAAISPVVKNINPIIKTETKAEIEIKNTVSNPVAVKTENNTNENTVVNNETPKEQLNTPAVIETKKEEVKIPVEENKNPVVVTKTDSTNASNQIVAIENKPDSTPKEIAKKEEIRTPDKITSVDSSKKSPFIPELALLLTGGPNIFSGSAQSNLYTTANENHPATINGEAKLQWRPLKLFSFAGGINYTSFTSKQDATLFKWNKKQTTDFLFYSPFGSMPVSMSTMNDGYFTGVPFDTFYAKYSYTSTLHTLNIPLEMNLHFLNKSKFNLYFGIGANTSIALAQQTHLTIIKENFNNDVTYNNVTANRFNMMLMISLGCDVRLTKHLYLTLTPSYKYGLTNLSSVSGTTYKPAYLSANAGLKFKF